MEPEPRKRATVSAMPIIAASDSEVDTEGRYFCSGFPPGNLYRIINQKIFFQHKKTNKAKISQKCPV